MWTLEIIDVEGAFLQGKFENGDKLYIEVPDEFKEWYPGDMNVLVYRPSKWHTASSRQLQSMSRT
jgi:hypothetical protein